MVTISKDSNSFIKIIGDVDSLKLISIHFTKPVEGFRFHPLYKCGAWDGQIRFFNSLTGLLPFGLYIELLSNLDRNKMEYIIDESLLTEITSSEIDDFHLATERFSLDVRDYQISAAKRVVEKKRGILEHPTGSGKTVTSYLIINYLLNKGYEDFLFVVPNKSLLAQTFSAFEKYGFPTDIIGKYFGDEKDDTKKITVGTWQSLGKNTKLLEKTKIIIVDEVHGVKAKELTNLLKKCSNTEYRIGVTGSLPKDETNRFSIIGGIGPVIDKIETNTLIYENKVLSEIAIKIFNLNYPKVLKKSIKEYQDEKAIIKNYDVRKKLFKTILKHYIKPGDNCLILFDEIELGENYKNFIEPFFPDKKIYWIEGSVKVKEREEIRLLTNTQEDVLVFGSLGTCSTGIDIPRLHHVIFLFAGKSVIRIKQSIGRGLRLHDSKDKVTIYDLADNLKYGKNHLLERMKIYADEGFPVELIEIPEKLSS